MKTQIIQAKRCGRMPFSGSRLRDRRKAAGFKAQKDLSAILEGISVKMISDYERGKEQPRANDLARLARATNTSTDYLCSESDVEAPLTVSQMKNVIEFTVIQLFRSGKLTTEKLKLAEKFRDLPESRQDEIVRLLNG